MNNNTKQQQATIKGEAMGETSFRSTVIIVETGVYYMHNVDNKK